MITMAERVVCDICGRVVPMNAWYAVKIEVFADPSAPAVDTDALQEKDFEKGMAELLAELDKYSTDELQDMVHRRFDFRVCRPCQMRFMGNPLGLPRESEPGNN